MEPHIFKMTLVSSHGRNLFKKQNIKRKILQFSGLHHKAPLQPSAFESSCVAALDSLVAEAYKPELSIVEHTPQEKREGDPLVLLFGWAGASHKNLSKYAHIYQRAGCSTVQYNLPSKFIFNYTNMVPHLMTSYMARLEGSLKLRDRPILVHCMSDGGLMSYQGLTLMETVNKIQVKDYKSLNIKGVVFDSCCGPYPEITLRDVSKFLLINFYCCLRDQIGLPATLESTHRLLVDRAWPNYLRRLRGLPVELSKMEGVWCGDFGKNHFQNFPERKELFLYSKRDFYLPYKFMEKEILPLRAERPEMVSWRKFLKSHHVQHLRKHKREYQEAINQFISHSLEEETEEDAEVELQYLQTQRKRFALDHPGISFF